MDDFMEKLLQEVSQDTNSMGAGQQIPSPQQAAQRFPMGNNSQQPVRNNPVNPMQATQSMPNMQQYGMPQQTAQNIHQPIQTQSIPQPQPVPQQVQQAPPVMQAQNMRQTVPQNNGYAQGGGRPISFEDVSYLPDADRQAGSRPLPGAEELAMEARKTEAYDERFRNNNAGMQGNPQQQAPAGRVDIDKDKVMEEVQSIVHTEVVKCYKNTEAAINDASRNVTESFEKISSPKNLYRVIIGLLIFNLLLAIILVLHNFLGVI